MSFDPSVISWGLAVSFSAGGELTITSIARLAITEPEIFQE
jgi:hypothetical protein